MKLYTTRAFLRQDCVRLSRSALALTRVTYERLDKPKFIEVWYDEEEKSIKIVPTESGVGRKLSPQTLGGARLVLKLSRIMPIGLYFADGDVFKLKTSTPQGTERDLCLIKTS